MNRQEQNHDIEIVCVKNLKIKCKCPKCTGKQAERKFKRTVKEYADLQDVFKKTLGD